MRDIFKNYQVLGIVIKRVNIGEADKLITIMTRYKGKIVARARGVRKITSRKAPHLELLTLTKLSIAQGKTWDYIIEAEMRESFPYLKSNLAKIAWVYKIIEQTDRLVREGGEVRTIFDTLISTLTEFNQASNLDLKEMADGYSLKLLWELGYLPKDRKLVGEMLDRYMEHVMEKSHKSNQLISRI